MTHIHNQDQPFRPDIHATRKQNYDSDATFALDADDPASVENRRGLRAVHQNEIEPDTSRGRSEYSSDPSFAENGMDDEREVEESIEEIISQDDSGPDSGGIEDDVDLQDQLEAELDEEEEEIEADLDDVPQRSEGSID